MKFARRSSMFASSPSPGAVEKVTDMVIGITILGLALAGWVFYFTSRNVGMVMCSSALRSWPSCWSSPGIARTRNTDIVTLANSACLASASGGRSSDSHRAARLLAGY